MKLIIDAPDEIIKKGFEEPLTDEERQILIRAIGNGTTYKVEVDLISRSALLKDLKEMKVEGEVFTTAVNFAIEVIDNAPTVSPNQGEWIPVGERLPEDMQSVLIWFEYYRYGDFNCMYQTYGFGYVCDGKWSPFINGETGWQDYRVIAWQPLPKPYKKGGAE